MTKAPGRFYPVPALCLPAHWFLPASGTFHWQLQRDWTHWGVLWLYCLDKEDFTFFIRLHIFPQVVSQPSLALDFTLWKGLSLSLNTGSMGLTTPQFGSSSPNSLFVLYCSVCRYSYTYVNCFPSYLEEGINFHLSSWKAALLTTIPPTPTRLSSWVRRNCCFISGISLSAHFHCTGETLVQQTLRNGHRLGPFHSRVGSLH